MERRYGPHSQGQELPARQSIPIALGRATLSMAEASQLLTRVTWKSLLSVCREGPVRGATARQMYAIGNQSLVFLALVMAFIGMIVVYQAGVQMLRIVPDMTQLGSTYLELLIKDLAASIGALVLTTRVGAGIAAEIAAMVVTEQIDALRMCGTDPVAYLIRPRLIASVVMVTVLSIVCGAVAFSSGMWTAHVYFDISPRTFADWSQVGGGDIITGLAKAIAYGAAIPLISGYCGLSAFGGSSGVGAATTRAVVGSSLAIIALDLLLSTLGFLLFG
jgi:phospholipid/cholesterol/gamma-HCH transport system permease protein